jgi:hypothetical protein
MLIKLRPKSDYFVPQGACLQDLQAGGYTYQQAGEQSHYFYLY